MRDSRPLSSISLTRALWWMVSYLFVGVFGGIEALILLALLFDNLGVGHDDLGVVESLGATSVNESI